MVIFYWFMLNSALFKVEQLGIVILDIKKIKRVFSLVIITLFF